jgi:hypothetical protein
MPLGYLQKTAQRLNVFHKMGGGVVPSLAVRSRTTRPTLVEQHDPVVLRIKETPVFWRATRSGTTVEEQDGHSGRVAALFPIDRMKVVYR